MLSLVQSVGMVGLYFTIPAGWCNDNLGAFTTSVGGAFLAGGGYVLMAFAKEGSWWMIGVGFTVSGFGAGAVFMAVLSTTIKSNKNNTGAAVALVIFSNPNNKIQNLIHSYLGALQMQLLPCIFLKLLVFF